MNDIIHTLKGTHHAFLITHISDKETKPVRIFLKFICHDKLLKFISGINNNLLRMIMSQHIFRKTFTKRSCSSGNQYGLVIQ